MKDREVTRLLPARVCTRPNVICGGHDQKHLGACKRFGCNYQVQTAQLWRKEDRRLALVYVSQATHV